MQIIRSDLCRQFGYHYFYLLTIQSILNVNVLLLNTLVDTINFNTQIYIIYIYIYIYVLMLTFYK